MEVFSHQNCHGYQNNTSPETWINIDANHTRILDSDYFLLRNFLLMMF